MPGMSADREHRRLDRAQEVRPGRPRRRRATRTRARAAARTIATRSSPSTCGSVRSAAITSPCAPASGSTQLADAGTFEEEDGDLRSADPLEFFDLRPYVERLAEAELGTGLGDAILTGRAAIEGQPCRIAAMDFSFMGGSMGSVVGERFARACERAAEDAGALISVSASGGARMQEGILALMQLPKTVAAVGRAPGRRRRRCSRCSRTRPRAASRPASRASAT